MHIIVVGCGRVGSELATILPHRANHKRLLQGAFMLLLTGLLFWARAIARRKRI